MRLAERLDPSSYGRICDVKVGSFGSSTEVAHDLLSIADKCSAIVIGIAAKTMRGPSEERAMFYMVMKVGCQTDEIYEQLVADLSSLEQDRAWEIQVEDRGRS